MLRPGNVHSANRWKELLEPIVRRYENKKVRKYFRGDPAFAKLFLLLSSINSIQHNIFNREIHIISDNPDGINIFT